MSNTSYLIIDSNAYTYYETMLADRANVPSKGVSVRTLEQQPPNTSPSMARAATAEGPASAMADPVLPLFSVVCLFLPFEVLLIT